MSDSQGRGGSRPGVPRPPRDDELSARLQDLERRLDASRDGSVDSAGREDVRPPPGMALAMRLGAEFVAGVAVGAALGWGFDRLVGTSPWGLIVFVLLGFGAGLLSVMRSAGIWKPGPAGADKIADRLNRLK